MGLWDTVKDIGRGGVRLIAKTIAAPGIGTFQEAARQATEIVGKLTNNIHTQNDYRGRDLSGIAALEPGDLLIKYHDGTPANELIQNFQMENPTQPYWFVHAGIVTDYHPNGTPGARSVVEMDGDGVICNDLSGYNRDYEYEVFRAKNDRIAKEVAALVRRLAQVGRRDKAVSYSFGGLVKTFADFDRMVTLDEFNVGYENMVQNRSAEKYYCSQLVVWMFEGARLRTGQSENLWGSGSVHRSPSSLAKIVKFGQSDHWTHVGRLPGGRR